MGEIMKKSITCQENHEFIATSRLHDLMIQCEERNPGEGKNVGEALLIEYGHSYSPFGHCFLATTHSGICKLAFFDSDPEAELIKNELREEWQNAVLKKNDEKIASLAAIIFAEKKEAKRPLKLFLKGSPFQLKVWEALLSIPETGTITYEQVALAIKNPKAIRAAASAVAKNNIAYLIPCHRVIRKNGDSGKYRWNEQRKKALLAWEASLSYFERCHTKNTIE
jgi:AraC family transcriptional regulator of adaptative response/methylated-DNA-[protein]-cysteine methyltransferase